MAKSGEEYWNAIVLEFGQDILKEDKEINRKKLANIVFNDKEKKNILDELTQKYVVEEIKKQISSKSNNVLDVPLLIESKLNKVCDYVISVISDERIKTDRICKRDNLTKEEALARIKAQPTNEFYIENSNYVIINNSNDSTSLNEIEKILNDMVI